MIRKMKTLKDKEKYYDVRFVEDFGNEYAIPTKDVKEHLNNFYNDYWKVSYDGDKCKKHITCDELDYLMAKHFGTLVNIKTLQDLNEFGDF